MYRIASADYQYYQTLSRLEIAELKASIGGMTKAVRVFEESRQTEEEKAFTSAVMRGQETERQWLSHEIHDTVLQDLSAQHLLSSKVLSEVKKYNDASVFDSVEKLAELAKTASAQLRSICQNLTPPDLDAGSLYNAFYSLCQNCARSSGIKCTYSCENDARPVLDSLETQVMLNVYRLVQETLSNAIRHAGAEELSVIVRLAKEPAEMQRGRRKSIVIFITDDGCGFDVEKTLASSRTANPGKPDKSGAYAHFGLRGMFYRAQQLNGALSVKSSAGDGTTVRLEF